MKNKTIWWKRGGAAVLMTAIFFLGGCGAPADESIATTVPTTEEIQYDPVELDMDTDALFFGRTYSKAGVEWMNWSGSGFSVRFRGSGLAAEFYSNAPDSRDLA